MFNILGILTREVQHVTDGNTSVTSLKRYAVNGDPLELATKFEFPYNILELTISASRNANIHPNYSLQTRGSNRAIKVTVDAMTPSLGTEAVSNDRYGGYLFVGLKASFNFLTCDGNQEFINFFVFLQPFDMPHTYRRPHIDFPVSCLLCLKIERFCIFADSHDIP